MKITKNPILHEGSGSLARFCRVFARGKQSKLAQDEIKTTIIIFEMRQ